MYARWASRWNLLLIIALLLTPLIASANGSAPAAARVDPKVSAAAAQADTTFWVILREKADLAPAKNIKGWKDRGQFVVDRLQDVANRSQGSIRSLLKGKGKTFQTFWIANAIKVTADQATLKQLATRPEVQEITADEPIPLPDPGDGKEEPRVDAIEWNVDRIRAPQVWSTFNVRGEGIVVANIDSGVLYTHPAVVNQYRGRNADGSFNHNYNWYDPANACNNGRTAPCDNNGHGTHTMGTIVGSDASAANQIGVAPRARWIAAKGCESSSCSTASLLAAGQWVLAPTDLSGQNPRADLRPNIVNNSWGNNNGSDTFYQATVQAWIASGIFPVFSNGNNGPACSTAGSPGSNAETYAVGAFDVNGAIASFSSRGSSPLGGIIKPNISAPGVNVRSAWNDGQYNSISGTSMAAPHVAGTIALMWSAAPTLVGDIAATRAILDQTAIDTSDLTCGGTAANNNVWGQGKLDAFTAVDQSPRGPSGTLSGVVTNTATNQPVAGVSVVAVGPSTRSATTGSDGSYSFPAPVGSYDVTASAFGYLTQTISGVSVADSATTTRNIALTAAPSYALSGTVRDSFNQPLSNVKVTVVGTPIPPATTDANGRYSFASVPAAEYDLRAEAGGCSNAETRHVVLNAAQTVNFTLIQRSDSFGYYCRLVDFNYIEAGTVLPLTGDDANVQVSLPFPFLFYGQTYNAAYVTTNGYLNFLAANNVLGNVAIPSTGTPNGAIYPFWDDLFVDASSSVRTQALGSAPNRQFVIEWRNIRPYGDTTRRMDFEVVLYETGKILTQYRNIADDGRERGDSATLGIENQAGTVALQYAYNQATVSEGLAVLYRLPPTGFVQGTLTDANDGQALAGATVKVAQNGTTVKQLTTDANGFYRALLPLGDYSVEASVPNYVTQMGTAALDVEDAAVTLDFALKTARAQLSPTALEFLVPPSGAPATRSAKLTLSNTGSAPLSWSLSSSAAWLTIDQTGGTLATGTSTPIVATASRGSLAPGVYNATLTLTSNSGRVPSITVAVRLVVPSYHRGVNVGGTAYTDPLNDLWAADQAYTSGGWGYVYKGTADTTRSAIAGTDADPLYQAARRGTNEWRFDGLPNGVYQVDLRFAEIKPTSGNKRIFDVIVENTMVLPAYDIAGKVGTYAADDYTFFVTVTDGQLNVKLAARRGFGDPTINAIRVTQRPDK